MINKTFLVSLSFMFPSLAFAANPAIVCQEPIDHGARISLYADADGSISRAVYTETSFFDTQVVADMAVCREFNQGDLGGADLYVLTAECHDVNWVSGYELEFYTGGLAGMSGVKVYQRVGSTTQRELVKDLDCNYEN